jgi:hypothetical protein
MQVIPSGNFTILMVYVLCYTDIGTVLTKFANYARRYQCKQNVAILPLEQSQVNTRTKNHFVCKLHFHAILSVLLSE